MAKDLKYLPKWRKCAKSGHTEIDLQKFGNVPRIFRPKLMSNLESLKLSKKFSHQKDNGNKFSFSNETLTGNAKQVFLLFILLFSIKHFLFRQKARRVDWFVQ